MQSLVFKYAIEILQIYYNIFFSKTQKIIALKIFTRKINIILDIMIR